MDEIVENFTVTLHFQTTVNTETGLVTTECIKKSIDKVVKAIEEKPKRTKSKKDECADPTLKLDDNKYYLNQAAIDLMGVKPDDKIDIKYEKQNGEIYPVIGTDESFGTKGGCRLTKQLSVACRGSKNSVLSEYGTEFLIIPHETQVGIFILQNKDAKLEKDIEDVTIELPLDDDLQLLIDEDAEITEVNSSLFKL